VLKYAGNYRSRARIPALTYLHPVNNCSITRSSQPLVGIRRNRSLQDEKLVEAICKANKINSESANQPNSQTDSQVNITQSSDTDLDPSALVEDAAIQAVNTNPDEPKKRVYGAQQNNLIVDARPTVNAYAMQAVGMGSEDMQYYACATKAYLGIDNIHVMRRSLQDVIDVLKDSDVSTLPLDAEQLTKSGWLKHISNMLDGTALIARTVGLNHSNVLIHCSDGWDRTSQLSALSQLCLDPYYRTIEGFIVLVEKDWLSFGHMFRHRTGPLGSEKWFEVDGERIAAPIGTNGTTTNGTSTGAGGSAFENARLLGSKVQGLFKKQESKESEESDSENPLDVSSGSRSSSRTRAGTDDTIQTKVNETSPVFHQFLDATYQLLYQHPTRFEFNERFLSRLLYHLYSCQYGSFLYDNEKQRVDANVKEKTRSVWDFFLARKKEFINEKYDPEIDDHDPMKERLIFPKKELVRWWAKGFGRTDDEMNPSPSSIASGYTSPEPLSESQGSDSAVASQLFLAKSPPASSPASSTTLAYVETADASMDLTGMGVAGARQPQTGIRAVTEGTNSLAATMASFGLGSSSGKASPSPNRSSSRNSPRVASDMGVEMQ
jgi:myotubularin-related protein 6/7/8